MSLVEFICVLVVLLPKWDTVKSELISVVVSFLDWDAVSGFMAVERRDWEPADLMRVVLDMAWLCGVT